ncbi:transcription factor MYB35 [Heracleum sosnowskyi]|uniref:Transcription factor MYB35 n=1 Tax=Heracleum sosnowskyi TaxID=360622 RepID=A0AAD8H3E9_9APIA|nr:transcription factor MYB35 [Heracleum sosnowskyi]
MVRPPCCERMNARKGNWSKEEDVKVLPYVPKQRTSNWTDASKKTGPRKCGKSCKHKCSNHLRPDKKHETFTPQEEELIINLHAAIGSRWPIIAQQLPGRTDNDVKNYWNTKLKKKLSGMGIDHVTHKPFSQIISDYSNIGAFPSANARVSYLNRDIASNSFIQKQEQYSPVQFSNYNSIKSPESFLSNSISNYTNDTQPLDLLTQLQSIALVKQPPNSLTNQITQPEFCNEYASSSSSSSPPAILNEGWVPSSFGWRDFLLEDAIPPQTPVQKENSEEVPAQGYLRQVECDIKHTEIEKELNKYDNENPVLSSLKSPAPSSSANNSSFVEAMLDEEHDMFLEFPSLLEEPYYY